MSLPVTVLAGYLGAGKTSLLNHLLRNAGGRRLAVMVNDFGTIGIDADLIEKRDGDVLELAGGCVCCSFGSDLVGALLALPERVPPPDHILIEASGVALPGSIVRTIALIQALRVDATVVVVDAETVRARAADRYVGDTVAAQLSQADLLVVNKLDLVDADAVPDLDGWLAQAAPAARIVHSTYGAVPIELILGIDDPASNEVDAHADADARHAPPPAKIRGESKPEAQAIGASMLPALRGDDIEPGEPRESGGSGRRWHRVGASMNEHFASTSAETLERVDLARLVEALSDPALGVLRAKGLFRDEEGALKSLQMVGRRVELRPSAHRDPARSRLACIGLRSRLDRSAIESALAASTVPTPPSG